MKSLSRFACVLVPCSFLFAACQSESNLDELEEEEELAVAEQELEGGACDLADAPWLFCDGVSVLENGQYATCFEQVACPCNYFAWTMGVVTCQDGYVVNAPFPPEVPPPPGEEWVGLPPPPPPPAGFPLPGWPEVCSGTPLDCYSFNRGF